MNTSTKESQQYTTTPPSFEKNVANLRAHGFVKGLLNTTAIVTSANCYMRVTCKNTGTKFVMVTVNELCLVKIAFKSRHAKC